MKKMVFGIILVIIGLFYSGICFVYAIMNPWDYNGITGLLGSFLGTQTLLPFIISFFILLTGIIICGNEAYVKNK